MATTFGRLGKMDAEDGEMCLPSMYTVNKREQAWYVAGFNSVANPLRPLATGQAVDGAIVVIDCQPDNGLYYPTDEEYAEDWAIENAPGYAEAQPTL